ncbi:MAG: hypothetical protein GYA51_01800 [Candidatus Methanofastidiosa archaeon]|nr:hypothetical protein [Candidatus Methanofastidiosa archaeon]
MKVFLDQTNKTQKLIAGLKNKIELVKNKGLDDQFVAQLETDNKFIKTENEEIEKLKAEMKSKIKKANSKLLEVKNQVKKAKKIIKLNFEQTDWKGFGISDLR